jgi:signal transduction histidine kinase
MNNPPRILLLDKDLDNEQYLSFMLKGNGYDVLSNGYGKDIKDAIDKLNPDIILLDATAVDSNYQEIYSEIRENHDTINPSIIFVTPEEKTDVLNELSMDGIVHDYIIKPFRSDEILSRIRTHLKIKAMIEQKLTFQDELQSSQKMANITTMTGVIAHDINNLVSAIMGYSDLLKFSIKEVRSMDYTDRILEASQKVAELSNSLLTYSRSMRSDPAYVDVDDLLRKLLTLYGESNSKKINYNLQIQDDIPKIFVDKDQICRAITGIFLNVKESTSENGNIDIEANVGNFPINTRFRRIETLSGQNKQQTKCVIITISDSDVYLDEFIAKKINDLFDVVMYDSKSEMSLSAAINIIKKNNGFFRVDTKPGIETRFSIYLPLDNGVKDELQFHSNR